jgi:hypothetical protein
VGSQRLTAWAMARPLLQDRWVVFRLLHGGCLLDLLFNPEDEGSMFLRNAHELPSGYTMLRHKNNTPHNYYRKNLRSRKLDSVEPTFETFPWFKLFHSKWTGSESEVLFSDLIVICVCSAMFME